MSVLQITFGWVFSLKEDANERLFVARKLVSEVSAGSGSNEMPRQIKLLNNKVDQLKNELNHNMEEKL